MNEIYKLLEQKIPKEILAQIGFMDEPHLPPNFFTCSAMERRHIFPDLMKFFTEPKKDNYWIWFGAYAKKDGHPVYFNERVVRPIYEATHGPLTLPNGKKRRLINVLVETLADVNPYKFLPASGTRYRNPAIVAAATGISIDQSKLLGSQKNKMDRIVINAGLQILRDNIESFPSAPEWEFALKAYNYDPDLIKEIIKEFENERRNSITSGDAKPSETARGFETSPPGSNTEAGAERVETPSAPIAETGSSDVVEEPGLVLHIDSDQPA